MKSYKYKLGTRTYIEWNKEYSLYGQLNFKRLYCYFTKKRIYFSKKVDLHYSYIIEGESLRITLEDDEVVITK